MTRNSIRLTAVLVVCVGCLARPAAGQDARPWVEPMRQVHAKFDGRPGTFAHLGDSITVTLAYWTPLLYQRKNAPAEMEDAYQRVSKYLARECWRDWKGSQFGSEGGMTVRWAHKNIDAWLARMDPEVALVMFGTNDLNSVPLNEHRKLLGEVIGKCLANGTVVILSTIPPRHGMEAKSRQFAEAQRQLAEELKVPLVDYHAEILRRRPDDWDGALEKFKDYQGYDVPTLIARDGVHPSNCKQYQDDYSEDGLRHNGFALRNYLSLMKYAEVMEKVLGVPGAGPTTRPGAQPAQRPGGEPVQPWFPKAPPLPPPAGQVIAASTVDELFKAVEQVKPGGTILLADGKYMLPRALSIRTDNVTLRSRSGRRDQVVLDAANSQHHEGIGVHACSGATIADLTLANVRQNGYKINCDSGVHRFTLYNCVGHNIWQRHVKGVPGQMRDGKRVPSADCRIQYCLFYNDRPKRLEDEPYEQANPGQFGGNYVGGIDAMNTAGWVISDNVFIGIRGKTGEARGAVFIWNGSADAVIERNVILDCDTGICLGNSHRAGEWEGVPHCTRFVVRNNFVVRTPENGILAAYTRDCRILHNTVHDPTSRLRRLLRVVHDNDGLVAAGNLFSGPGISVEKYQGQVDIRDNLVKPVPDYFVDAARGDLHLTARAVEAIDRLPVAGQVAEDIDRQVRRGQADLGADELAR